MEEILNERIVRIEKTVLRGQRPRSIGYNARIPTHGPGIGDHLARLHTAGGAWGLGWVRLDREGAEPLLGRTVGDLFQLPEGTNAEGRPLDLPLWDLVARAMDLPLYRLLGARGQRRIELYDGSIYIDDLEADDDQARDIFFAEVASGQEHGFTNFKIKVGRGARWMAPDAGMARDALVIDAVRQAAGPDAKILIDANMGNTLNSAVQLLETCAAADIYWFEEPFAEDRPLNQALKDFIVEQDLDTLVADGEFAPPPNFFDMVRDGLIDVVQHDFRFSSLTWWREKAAMLERWGDVYCAPHTWGSYFERFHHAHFAASVPNYLLMEAAPITMPGVIDDGWTFVDGHLTVPDTPGAGFTIEPRIFEQGLKDPSAFVLAR